MPGSKDEDSDPTLLLRAKIVEQGAHQAYLNAVIRNIKDSLIVMDRDAILKVVNAATGDLLERREDELLGRPAGLIFANAALFKETWERLLSEGTCRRMLAYRTASGAEIPMDLSASVAWDARGSVVAVVAVARDMRETLKLQSRMAQIEKMAAVGRLAGGVAHEINNPLGVILGFAQSMARRVSQGDPFELAVKSIEREALRCKHLVQNLLVFSRSSQPEHRQEVDLNACVEQALPLVLAQAGIKDVEVLRELDPNTPKLRVNRNQIEQVIINLCGNAIDAMPGGGQLTVRTGRGTRGGSLVATLEVRDTGTGIPKELQARIFEPFFTTKEPGKGTGLGLALVHEMISKHDGVIEVSSEEGKGTSFIIQLPASDVK